MTPEVVVQQESQFSFGMLGTLHCQEFVTSSFSFIGLLFLFPAEVFSTRIFLPQRRGGAEGGGQWAVMSDE